MEWKKWTTSEQDAWLAEQEPNFVQAQKDKKVPQFFAPIYSKFHKRWPCREPTQKEIDGEGGDKAKAKAKVCKKENEVFYISSDMEYQLTL